MIDIDEILERNYLYPKSMTNIHTRDGKDGNQLERVHKAVKDILEQYTQLIVKNAKTETIGQSDGYEHWEITTVDEVSITNCLKQVKYD